MADSAAALWKVGVIGGETHLEELTRLAGTRLRFIGAAVRKDQQESIRSTLKCPIFDTHRALLAERPDVVAVANENDRRGGPILDALDAGCDVIVDKPLTLHADEQQRIEAKLRATGKRLLMLLTLRGAPPYVALRDVALSGRLGDLAFIHIRMSVQLKRQKRPAWFLDSARSGGLFLDLLIHGLDYLEWMTGRRIVNVTAATGNLGHPDDAAIRDHASVYCRLDNGATAVVEGQRTLPHTKDSDYRVHVAGTRGYADLEMEASRLTVTDAQAVAGLVESLPPAMSVVEDFLNGGCLVPQAAALRANRLALAAGQAAATLDTIETR